MTTHCTEPESHSCALCFYRSTERKNLNCLHTHGPTLKPETSENICPYYEPIHFPTPEPEPARPCKYLEAMHSARTHAELEALPCPDRRGGIVTLDGPCHYQFCDKYEPEPDELPSDEEQYQEATTPDYTA